MSMRSWVHNVFARPATRPARKAPHRARLGAVSLEDRTVPSTFTVTNTLDDLSPGSLRVAVARANLNPGPDTIAFDAGVFGTPQTITLSGSPLVLGDAAATTITGPGANRLSISGNGASRVFTVNAGASAALSGLTITGGKDASGGGLSNGGTLVLTGCTVSGNMAQGAGSGGGLSNGGTLVLTGCTVSGNSAWTGGGLSNGGTLALTGCTVSGNMAQGDGDGGGLYNTGGSVRIDGTTFTANEARRGSLVRGGGLAVTGGSVVVTNSTFDHNRAEGRTGGSGRDVFGGSLTADPGGFGGTAQGGGICVTGGSVTVTGCTFVANQAQGGDGGNGGYARDGTVANPGRPGDGGRGGDAQGGALAVINGGSVAVLNCTFSDGQSAQRGRGGRGGAAVLRVREGNQYTYKYVSSGKSGGSGSGSGGAAFVSSTSATASTFTNCTFARNTAQTGGGMYVHGGAVTVNNTLLAANTGGDLVTDGGTLAGASNLVGVGTAATGLADGANGNKVGTAASPIDPKLGPLQDNGGPTKTLAPLPGSPALDAGSSALVPGGVTTDQRGFARVVGAAVDIGAVEDRGPPARVESVQVNGGSAQRSLVTSLTVTFSGPVIVGDRAFTLTADAGGAAVGLTRSVSIVNFRIVVTLTFTGPGVVNGSLADGGYTLHIAGSRITNYQLIPLDGDGDGVAGGDYSLAFHRLFGDGNGDKKVDALDLFAFAGGYGKRRGDAAYRDYLDRNGDGAIDALDLFAFAGNYGKTLP